MAYCRRAKMPGINMRERTKNHLWNTESSTNDEKEFKVYESAAQCYLRTNEKEERNGELRNKILTHHDILYNYEQILQGTGYLEPATLRVKVPHSASCASSAAGRSGSILLPKSFIPSKIHTFTLCLLVRYAPCAKKIIYCHSHVTRVLWTVAKLSRRKLKRLAVSLRFLFNLNASGWLTCEQAEIVYVNFKLN